ncbi:adenylate/guanylate cyclase domain-containing protein [Mucilaginibacter psychrotolerans]|uniref:Adenylate/guanylate cyclase domain-containing protein n=1 Tax=Mucilaginibacter psychrotolerans TaxID=1524096 RepID=A0A4Y8SE43_9SPHI|nr:adenylate/guanylate cyclase domain-containing protein [Mucilaginibacter psychrotolerans]TFF36724.1 adenylate/guanylate cyclase domain-containing protein [Mucilaginibacter psychrotolerans]
MKNNNLTHNTLLPAIATAIPYEEKELAILFLDIRNFTGLMVSQPEQHIIQIVRRLFTAFNQIIKSFSGKVIETAGDSLYAVFGLQDGLPEAVNNAYLATKAMFRTVGLFNDSYAVDTENAPLEMGAGLHAGRVFIDEFSLEGTPQLAVMGLPVNITARLQAKTRELNNDLLISEYAYHFLNEPETTAGVQTVTLQGIAQGQQIRLAGGPYYVPKALAEPDLHMSYLLAISG